MSRLTIHSDVWASSLSFVDNVQENWHLLIIQAIGYRKVTVFISVWSPLLSALHALISGTQSMPFTAVTSLNWGVLSGVDGEQMQSSRTTSHDEQ